MKSLEYPRHNILGVKVSTISMTDAIRSVQLWIEQTNPQYICVTPAHSIMNGYRNSQLRKIFNHSGLTTPDGMAIVWILKLAGYSNVTRVYGPDLMLALCEESLKHGWSHYLYGGAQGVADKLSHSLSIRFSGLKIHGVFSPPFSELSPEEDQQIVNIINSANPDIVWIGISSPKQELWMAEHVGRIKAPVLVGVGAAFDYLSGSKKQAPRWIRRIGMEWLFRFVSEPRRLWKRYIEYPYFALLVLAQLTGLKKFPPN